MDVAPWCNKWNWIGYADEVRYREPYGANNHDIFDTRRSRLYLILHVLICRVFQVVTNISCLVQVDLASFLNLQVLKHNCVGAAIEQIKEYNRLDGDVFENIFHKKPNPAQ